MAGNNGMQKKKGAFDYVLIGMLLIGAVFLGCIIGKSFDNTLKDDGSSDIMAALNDVGNSFSAPMTAVNSAIGDSDGREGYAH